MKFVLTVQLGNERMKTGEDVGRLLKDISEVIEHFEFTQGVSSSVSDDNGNKVGKWSIEGASTGEEVQP